MTTLALTASELAPMVENHWRDSAYPAAPQRGWDSWDSPHRATLPQAVACCLARSVYEIGCGAGPNLRLLRATMPDVVLGGCDIRQSYVDWCRGEWLAVEAASLPHKIGPEWDATLSCYTLAYCHPETVMAQLRMIESPSLILMEPDGDGEVLQNGNNSIPRWYHDWFPMLRETGWRVVWRWPLNYIIDDLRALLVAQRG